MWVPIASRAPLLTESLKPVPRRTGARAYRQRNAPSYPHVVGWWPAIRKVSILAPTLPAFTDNRCMLLISPSLLSLPLAGKYRVRAYRHRPAGKL